MSSKISWHFIGSPSAYTDHLFHANVQTVKLLNWDSETDFDLLATRIPIRIFRLDLDKNYRDISPDAYANALPAKLHGRGIIFEGINEPVIATIDDAKTLNAWYLRYAEILHSWGEKVAAFSFSTGNPPLDLTLYLAEAAAASDYLAFHEYLKPGPNWTQIGRYKEFLSRLPSWARKQVLITETGCDDGGCYECGWMGEHWKLTTTQYLAYLDQIDNVYTADDWVAGAQVFQCGGGGDWAKFNIASISKPLSNQIYNKGGGYLPPMPVPTYPRETGSVPADPYLASFPRPVGDNGRGLHFILDVKATEVAKYVPVMKALRMKWTTVYGGDENTTTYAAKQLLDGAGTYSILRVEARLGSPKAVSFWQALVVKAQTVGVPPYVQIFNEPEIEWDTPAHFAQMWNARAAVVVAAGGFPGLQVMTKEFFDAAVDGMTQAVKDKFFIIQHNYGANHPPEYPYNIEKTPVEDDTCVLRFLAIEVWAKAKLNGRVPPIIGGEGGWLYQNADDKTLPPVYAPEWVNWHYQMYEWFRSNSIPGPNGTLQALPDYVFSVTPWLLFAANWYSDSWMFGLDSDKKKPLLDKLASDEVYVRRFGVTPAPPPTVSFTLTPDTIQVGGTAVLKWDCDNVKEVWLDGEPQVGHGQKTITGTVVGVTVYTLRVVYPDGSEHIFPKTLTVTFANVSTSHSPSPSPSPSLPPPPSDEVEFVYCPPDTPLKNYKFLTWTKGVKAKVAKIVIYDNRPVDDPASEGGVDILAVVKDRYEHQSSGEAVIQRWPDGSSTHYTRNGEVSFSMSGNSIFYPDRGQSGPYAIEYEDVSVKGFGLPAGQHVEFLVKFTKEV